MPRRGLTAPVFRRRNLRHVVGYAGRERECGVAQLTPPVSKWRYIINDQTGEIFIGFAAAFEGGTTTTLGSVSRGSDPGGSLKRKAFSVEFIILCLNYSDVLREEINIKIVVQYGGRGGGEWPGGV